MDYQYLHSRLTFIDQAFHLISSSSQLGGLTEVSKLTKKKEPIKATVEKDRRIKKKKRTYNLERPNSRVRQKGRRIHGRKLIRQNKKEVPTPTWKRVGLETGTDQYLQIVSNKVTLPKNNPTNTITYHVSGLSDL